MANTDLIDFNVIEDHKENIQALPSGRSAKALAALYSPPLTSTAQSNNAPDAHAGARAAFEEELALIDEADDPLDVYDRYVKWTLDTYPSAQSTPQSQLLPLLERATKAFLSSANYNNDPRYLKLWLHYIRFFSDAPRETFVFLSRHGIGESLALYYEEYAAWLEHSGRWTQSEEVYKMGIEKEAHPAARLLRKFGQFERRKEARPDGASEPTSPALPAARPALATKVDPFASATDAAETQQRPTSAPGKKSKSGKMAIFSDDGAEAQSALSAADSGKGWDSIGSLASRKKENKIEAKPWAGETLKGGKTNSGVQKMMIFKVSLSRISSPNVPNIHDHRTNGTASFCVIQSSSSSSVRPAYESSNHTSQRVINPRTGRAECVFVNLEAVYPDPSNPSVEYCFEELMARHRGWLEHDWAAEKEDGKQEEESAESMLEREEMTEEQEEKQEEIQEEQVPQSPPKPVQRKGFAIFQDENAPAAPKTAIYRDEPTQPSQQPPAHQKRGFEIFHDGGNPTTQESAQDRPPIITIDSSFQVLSLNDENAENRPPAQQNTQTRDAQAQRDADVAIAKRLRKEERANRTRKIKVMDVETVQKETQTIKINMASPTGPKIRKRKIAEPTMTINTKEAMEEIYGIFSQPVETNEEPTEESELESDSDDDYTSGGESTTSGHISATGSDYGDETRREILASQTAQEQQTEELDEEQEEADDNDEDDADDDKTDVSAWSDYTSSKHVSHGAESEDDLPRVGGKKLEVFSDTDLDNQDEIEDDLPTPREDVVTPYAEEDEPKPKYIPLPPEDYEPMRAQYRDAAFVAQNRLPFMTPIVEHTESSIGTTTGRTEKGYFALKTPSRQHHNHVDQIPPIDEDGPWSSPFQDMLKDVSEDRRKVLQPIRTKTTKGIVSLGGPKLSKTKPSSKDLASDSHESANKGPIIKDPQINPVDPEVRQTILSQIRPPLTSYDGYHEHLDTTSNRVPEIRKFSKAVAKKPASATDKTSSTVSLPPLLDFTGTDCVYTLKRELGAGAFAPVYLVENSEPTSKAAPPELSAEDENAAPAAPLARMGRGAFASTPRSALEAVKMEDPPSAWEFYMIRQSHRRLGVSRAAESIVHAYEMHVFRDEGFLVEEFRGQGTLLDLVNVARAEAGGSMDELLAMFFAVELVRTVEALHKVGVVHGDLKGDNVLVRFEDDLPAAAAAVGTSAGWSAAYSADGSRGWSRKGVTLIDFGRGIDMRVFAPGVQFVADWPTSSADCAEMREMRPWTYQVDYHGLAGLLHSLLFGKYMATVAERGGGLGQGATKTYRIREGLKRYWQTEIWNEVFSMLLNPLAHVGPEEGGKLPLVRGLRGVREKMEGWLEANCERGVGLKALIRKMEEAVRARKR